MTTIFDLYDLRGELLDTKYEAAINERPFYLQSSLDDINDQIRLLENITPEAQVEYFDPRTPEQRDLDEWQAESALTRENDRPYYVITAPGRLHIRDSHLTGKESSDDFFWRLAASSYRQNILAPDNGKKENRYGTQNDSRSNKRSNG